MAKELNEDTSFKVSVKTLIAIAIALSTVIGMWFALQADIDEAKELIMERGDKFHVYRGLRHQMFAIEDSDLFEFSTQHFDSDSNRIIHGD